MSTYDVLFWAIKHRADRRKRYQVRWVVARQQFAESFINKALADSFRSGLMKAARSGEPFDEVIGRPESQAREVSWFDHAREYVARK